MLLGKSRHVRIAMPGATTMNAKKLFLIVVVMFLGFWMFTDPNGLAQAARAGVGQVWDLATQLFSAVIDFIAALT